MPDPSTPISDEAVRLQEEVDAALIRGDAGWIEAKFANRRAEAAEAEVAELRAALGEIVAKAKEDWAEDPFDSSVVAWGIETTPDEFPALYTFLATTLREGKA